MERIWVLIVLQLVSKQHILASMALLRRVTLNNKITVQCSIKVDVMQ